MRLLRGVAVLAALSFALPATADTIHEDHHGDADDNDSVVTSVTVHPSHDARTNDNDNAQWDEDSTNNNDNAQGDEDSNDDHDGFATTDSDEWDGPSNPTQQNDPLTNDPPVATPEPNAFLLLGTGIAMAVAFRRKRSRIAV